MEVYKHKLGMVCSNKPFCCCIILGMVLSNFPLPHDPGWCLWRSLDLDAAASPCEQIWALRQDYLEQNSLMILPTFFDDKTWNDPIEGCWRPSHSLWSRIQKVPFTWPLSAFSKDCLLHSRWLLGGCPPKLVGLWADVLEMTEAKQHIFMQRILFVFDVTKQKAGRAQILRVPAQTWDWMWCVLFGWLCSWSHEDIP